MILGGSGGCAPVGLALVIVRKVINNINIRNLLKVGFMFLLMKFWMGITRRSSEFAPKERR